MNEFKKFDYDQADLSYSSQRRPDPRIAKQIHEALGAAKTVLNIGAGAGSYEPLDRYVLAIEPSSAMRMQRPTHLAPAMNGTSEAIPFDDGAFDAAMAILTVHHWKDRAKSLRELRRVTKGPIVIMTFDPLAETQFWMGDYAPELVDVEKRRYGTLDSITEPIGGNCQVRPVSVSKDCTDGFQVAYYARPEAFLRREVRRSQSAWGYISPEIESRIVNSIADDLKSGKWDKKYGHLRDQLSISCQLRLIIAQP